MFVLQLISHYILWEEVMQTPYLYLHTLHMEFGINVYTIPKLEKMAC